MPCSESNAVNVLLLVLSLSFGQYLVTYSVSSISWIISVVVNRYLFFLLQLRFVCGVFVGVQAWPVWNSQKPCNNFTGINLLSQEKRENMNQFNFTGKCRIQEFFPAF